LGADGSVQRFGEFELDRGAYELRRRGRPVRLEGRAMSLLMLLLERPGELVTRAEIVARLWGTDAFVDVESGINTAVRKLRAALRDSAEDPKAVRTVHGKGYRFIAKLQPVAETAADPAAAAQTPVRDPSGRLRRLRWAGASLAVAAAFVLLLAVAPRPPPQPRVQVLPLSIHNASAGSKAFAAALTDNLAGVLRETGIEISAPPRWALPSLRPRPPDLVFSGSVSERQGVTSARLFLTDMRSGVTLWSHEFKGPTEQQ
jgi:DNA-binding winged helix-turn-helix (wHTH) protein